MSSITLTRGIQASGKSEFARRWVAEDPENRVRVNRDDIRRMITGTDQLRLSHAMELQVSRIETNAVLSALRSGRDVIVDAMHLRAVYVRRWYKLCDDVRFVDFPIALNEALSRNMERGRPVPNHVIKEAFHRFTPKGVLPPIPEREAPQVEVAEDITRYVQDWTLPSAVIVDIDGTLAHTRGRSPYDMSRVHEDVVDVDVATLVNTLNAEHEIILMSGRTDDARAATEQWLRDNHVRYDQLHMRAFGDGRDDAIVKRELFDAHVRHEYNVHAVIDDRPKVCRGWRAMGLTVMQVGDPAKEF